MVQVSPSKGHPEDACVSDFCGELIQPFRGKGDDVLFISGGGVSMNGSSRRDFIPTVPDHTHDLPRVFGVALPIEARKIVEARSVVAVD